MDKNLIWKHRAIERRLENKEINKRRKELTISRDNWKDKYMLQKQLTGQLEKQLVRIKKKLKEILVE